MSGNLNKNAFGEINVTGISLGDNQEIKLGANDEGLMKWDTVNGWLDINADYIVLRGNGVDNKGAWLTDTDLWENYMGVDDNNGAWLMVNAPSTNLIIRGIPTSDPSFLGGVYNSSGTLKISAGP